MDSIGVYIAQVILAFTVPTIGYLICRRKG